VTNRRRFSERELDIMQTLWSLGREASAAEVHEAMGESLAYTTVQTMLQRLEVKGHLRRRLVGRAYHYVPVVKEPAAARAALRSLVKRFFGGSAVDLATHLVDEELSDEELKRVERLLEERR
jgi:BlaI family transcriptional regulator, penicillinase repressor